MSGFVREALMFRTMEILRVVEVTFSLVFLALGVRFLLIALEKPGKTMSDVIGIVIACFLGSIAVSLFNKE